MPATGEAYSEVSKFSATPINTESVFPSSPVRFPGPGLKRSHPGTDSRSNKPLEPVISQIIDKLKHINQVSFVLAPFMFVTFFLWAPCNTSSSFLYVHKLPSSFGGVRGFTLLLVLPLGSELHIHIRAACRTHWATPVGVSTGQVKVWNKDVYVTFEGNSIDWKAVLKVMLHPRSFKAQQIRKLLTTHFIFVCPTKKTGVLSPVAIEATFTGAS